MTKHQLAAICCKILGLYTTIVNLQMLAMSFGSMSMGMQTNGYGFYMAMSLLGNLIALSAGVGLWAYADHVAERIVGQSRSGSLDLAITPDRVQSIAFSVVGLSVLVRAIPNIIRLAVEALTTNLSTRIEFYGGISKTGQIKASDIAFLVIELGIGLWLVFRADGFVGMINSLRNAGLRKQ